MSKLNEPQKFDTEKLRWDLLPMEEIEEIVKIITYGSNKYEDNSWQLLDKGIDRYYAALLRHLVAWRNGEQLDSESGFKHLAHMACNAVFLLYLTKNKITTPKKTSLTRPGPDMKYNYEWEP